MNKWRLPILGDGLILIGADIVIGRFTQIPGFHLNGMSLGSQQTNANNIFQRLIIFYKFTVLGFKIELQVALRNRFQCVELLSRFRL